MGQFCLEGGREERQYTLNGLSRCLSRTIRLENYDISENLLWNGLVKGVTGRVCREEQLGVIQA